MMYTFSSDPVFGYSVGIHFIVDFWLLRFRIKCKCMYSS